MKKKILRSEIKREYVFENNNRLVVVKINSSIMDVKVRWYYNFFIEGEARSSEFFVREGHSWQWIDADECAERYARDNDGLKEVIKHKIDRLYAE